MERSNRNHTSHRASKEGKITDLLGVLSKPGALRIFLSTAGGMRSSMNTYLHLGITRKQYYTRLSQLVKLGLVRKYDRRYVQTSFGRILCQEYIPRLEDALPLNPSRSHLHE